MPRRHSRRARSDQQATLSLALALFVGGGYAYRWIAAVPLPWQIAGAGLVLTSLLLIGWGVRGLLRERREARLLHAQLLALSPADFERRVMLLLADLSWTQLQQRGGSGDRGVDLEGFSGGARYVVQCKRYSKPVPPAMVRDLVGTRHIQGADCALLVTTSRFTAQGYAEVAAQPVELWDGDDLAQQIRLAAALRDDPARAQARCRRTTLTLLTLLALNSSTLLWAFITVGLPSGMVAATAPAIAVVAPPRVPDDATPLPPSSVPGQNSQPPLPTATAAPDLPTARVTNGGNVRAAPSLQGAVVGQIHANQTVELLGRTTDGVWLRISAGPQMTGWTHQSLLRLDPLMVQRLPVLTP